MEGNHHAFHGLVLFRARGQDGLLCRMDFSDDEGHGKDLVS